MSAPRRVLTAMAVSAIVLLPFTPTRSSAELAQLARTGTCDADDTVVRLACRVSKRAQLMQAVAAYKAANGGSIYNASREAAVLARVETTASAPHKTATMLFAQIQMDLAKTLQAAWQSLWKKTDSAAQASESLDALRDELNGLGDAIAADLVSLRSRNNCPANELETALRESLDSLEAPVAQETLVRHARMLAAAACSSAVKR